METHFERDPIKELLNREKHGVSFDEAQYAFLDRNRIIARDLAHSDQEPRYYCFGKDREGRGILTVRFTYREGRIRIIGAGYWRKGKKLYEQKHSLQR